MMHNVIFAILVCIEGRKLTYFWLGKVPRACQTLDIELFLDTINVINVKLCMMVLPIEIHLFLPLSVTLTLFQGHSCVKQF